ncbi:DUF6966 domain-containing protein [Lelliottia amnigena]|jgi:hypothetical protein|uniref:DUF6966 domain-containing protein n=1 Tax=Lelliottia amnigena TaxID=61646 RepID=UPI00192A9B5E|nr:hypothetical protein [Lelliottia amnigena]MBL5931204.1 hypothetical protein [Lelliottia amnigena]MCE9966426.1 hypothetical protein [Lelliottia amnigena]QXZ19448.1 hypothetical protein I6L75_20585 [Lelliottia amnigena]
MKNEIKKTAVEIANILSSNDEVPWAKAFEKLGSELDVDYESSLHSLKGFYGGMGSFNDIVLHKNGIPLIRENNELDDLRHLLYKQLAQAIEALKAPE